MAPAPVLAVHNEGLFELDGNAVDTVAPGDDWNSTNNAEATVFIGANKEDAAHDTTYFTSGGSKDVNDISQWKYTANDIAPDKDQILDAYAAAYQKNGDTFVYFGADRFDGSGDAFIGFWFVQSKLSLDGNGGFNGVHKDGDILVVSDFTNGGSVSQIDVYEWLNGALKLKDSGATCDVPGAEQACAEVNKSEETAPWPFLNKTGATNFAAGEFYEGGVNLDTIFGGDAPCFSSFLAETRSSQSTTAQLKDFALGSFNTCKPPAIDTQVSKTNVDFGGTVSDTATLSGNDGPVTGTVKFYVCGPEATAPDCSTGGTQVGGAVTIAGGTATSADYTVGLTAAASGRYCWRAVYTPDAASQYLAGSHTNTTTECFKVDPATIAITKTASPVGPVNAGDEIGFDITVKNEGTQTTLGINASDTLPAGISWTDDDPTGSTTGLSCSIASGVLTCTKPSLAAGASFTVHIHGMTDAADCGTVENSASVGTSNDGSDTAKDSVVVNCPIIVITKVADATSVSAGEPIGFTVKVENTGKGTAKGVTVSDPLPTGTGISWSEDPDAAGWSISGGNLGFGPVDLAPGDSSSVHISSDTTEDSCKLYDNTASVEWTNKGTGDAKASVEVLCPDITVVKTAVKSPVNAGDPIAFDITVSNSNAAGTGTAYGVTLNDPLPNGITWSEDSAACLITGTGDDQVLDCNWDSLAKGASATVRISGTTSLAVCGNVPNTATVSASNERQADTDDNSDSATVVVDCPDIKVVKTAGTSETVQAADGTTLTVESSTDNVTYKYVVTNTGNVRLVDVTVSDDYGTTTNPDDDFDVTVCEDEEGIALTAPFGLDAGAWMTCFKVLDVSQDTTNIATAAGASVGLGTPVSATDDAKVRIVGPAITVLKTAGASAGSQAADGATYVTEDFAGNVTYVYVVTNTGTTPLVNISLVDDKLGAITCPATSLPVDDDETDNHMMTCTATTRVSVDTENIGTATGFSPAGTRKDASDPALVDVVTPKITVVKTAGSAADNTTLYTNGGDVTYTYLVTNTGDVALTNVTLSDNKLGAISCPATSLAVNTSMTCTIKAPVTVDTTNIATVTGETPHAKVSDFDDAVVKVRHASIVKTNDTEGKVAPGSTVGYTLTLTVQNGPIPAMTVTDLLPANFGAPSAISDGGTYDTASRTITWQLASVANGETLTYTVVIATTTQGGTYTNTATITDGPCVAEACSDDSVVPVWRVAIDKANNTTTPVKEGADVVYTLTFAVQNGPITSMVVTDTLPVQMVNPRNFSVAPVSIVGQVITWNLKNVADGSTITYTASVAVGTPSGSYKNVAVITEGPCVGGECDDDSVVNTSEVEEETGTPEITPTPTPKVTPPPTDAVSSEPSQPDNSLLYLVFAILGLVVVLGVVTPMPARARRRDRRN